MLDNTTKTVMLLCIGYFIDFYDLTLFAASYTQLIKNLFHIYDAKLIQQLYLKINNYYTLGIFLGCITFGILADKLGRVKAIRLSILLYSCATIACVFTSSINTFILFRFLAGFGLAAEFAISSVLISELNTAKLSSIYTTILYFCGILGGITATILGSLNWQLMFILGGVAGLVLYCVRKNIIESQKYTALALNIEKGNIFSLFNSWYNISKFFKLYSLIIPFYFLISVMFTYLHFMPLEMNLTKSVKILLIGFFIGNLVSTISCSFITNKFQDYRVFIAINLTIFSVIMPLFSVINSNWFFIYAFALGLLGGGLPTTWIQLTSKSFGINLRTTATNTLYAFGRINCIGFNLLNSYWLNNRSIFVRDILILILLIIVINIFILSRTKNNYQINTNFTQ